MRTFCVLRNEKWIIIILKMNSSYFFCSCFLLKLSEVSTNATNLNILLKRFKSIYLNTYRYIPVCLIKRILSIFRRVFLKSDDVRFRDNELQALKNVLR